MSSVELHPATQALAEALFPPGFFDVDLRQLAKKEPGKKRSDGAKSGGGRRSGQKSLLSAEDFILPQLVTRDDNGDLSVSIDSSSDDVQLEQISDLLSAERNHYQTFLASLMPNNIWKNDSYSHDLKRVPRHDVARAV